MNNQPKASLHVPQPNTVNLSAQFYPQQKVDMNHSYDSTQIMYEPISIQQQMPQHMQQQLPGQQQSLGSGFSFQNEQVLSGLQYPNQQLGNLVPQMFGAELQQQLQGSFKDQANQLHMLKGNVMPINQTQQYNTRAGHQGVVIQPQSISSMVSNGSSSVQQYEQIPQNVQFTRNAMQLTQQAAQPVPLGLNTFMAPSPASSQAMGTTNATPQNLDGQMNNPFKTLKDGGQHVLNDQFQATYKSSSSQPSKQDDMNGKENQENNQTARLGKTKSSKNSKDKSRSNRRGSSRMDEEKVQKDNKESKKTSRLHSRSKSRDKSSKEQRKSHNQQLSEQFVCSVQFNEVYVWGDNQNGQLGLGTLQKENFDPSQLANDNVNESHASSQLNFLMDQNGYTLLPKICCFNTVITKVSCGMSHTLLLSSSGHVYSMGSNQYGQLGLDIPFEEGKQPIKKLLPCLLEKLQDYQIVDIEAGNDHSMALTQQGDKLFSWGQGKFGALGLSRSQNMKTPTEIELPDKVRITSIAAGARHSAFVTDQKKLYTFGLAMHGQLGLGEDCTDRVFKPERVDLGSKHQILQVALGDTHSLLLTVHGYLMSTGANDKYQLGINPDKRSLKLFNFSKIKVFKTGEASGKQLTHKEVTFKKIFTWNLNAAIDEEDRAYLWGILHDKQVKQSLCIKIPERVNSFNVENVAIGPTMAMLVDKQTQQPCVIGVNAKGELGLGDIEQRKTFCILNELKEKKIRLADIGKSGFVIALADQVIDPEDHLFSMENPGIKGSVDDRDMYQMTTENGNETSQYSLNQPNTDLQTPQQQIQSTHQQISQQDQFVHIPGQIPMLPPHQISMMPTQQQNQQIQDIQNQVNNLTQMTHLNMRIQFLEEQVNKKQTIIKESDRRHAGLLDKIDQLENKLTGLDRQNLEREIDLLKQQVLKQQSQQQTPFYSQAPSSLTSTNMINNMQSVSNQLINSDQIQNKKFESQLPTEAKPTFYSQVLPEPIRPNSNVSDQLPMKIEEQQQRVLSPTSIQVKQNEEAYKQRFSAQSQCNNIKSTDIQQIPITTRSENFNTAPKITNESKSNIEYRSQHHEPTREFNQATTKPISSEIQQRAPSISSWDKAKEGLESQYAKEKIQRGDPIYRSEITVNNVQNSAQPSKLVHDKAFLSSGGYDLTRKQEMYNARDSIHSSNNREKSAGSRFKEGKYEPEPAFSQHSKGTRGSSVPHKEFNKEFNMEHESIKSTVNVQSQYAEYRSSSYERARANNPRSLTYIEQPRSEVSKKFEIQLRPAPSQNVHYSPPRSVHSHKSYQSRKREITTAEAEQSKQLAEKLVKSETALYQVKVDYARRDTEAKEAEERIQSMTQKLDSLVKFLEEERSLRKKVQAELQAKEQEIVNLTIEKTKQQEVQDRSGQELQQVEGKMNAMKDDIDRLRLEKSQAVEDKQELEHKMIDLESRLRTVNKQLADKEADFERQLKEKYDAQNKQFLLQQEMNQHTSQQFQYMASSNNNQFEVQRKLVEQQRELMPVRNSISTQNDNFGPFTSSQPIVRELSSHSGKKALNIQKQIGSGEKPSSTHTVEKNYLKTEQQSNKVRERSNSQDHWSANNAAYNQITPKLASSVPNISTKTVDTFNAKNVLPELQKKYEYSFQQYQQKGYDFMTKKIGSDDGKSRVHTDLTSLQTNVGSQGLKSKIQSSSFLIEHKDNHLQSHNVGEGLVTTGNQLNLETKSRQSPWQRTKPVETMKVDVSREMSIEKPGRSITPSLPDNISYISRFGQELKAGSIQQKLENLQKGYRELTKSRGGSSSVRAGLLSRSKSGERYNAQIKTQNNKLISKDAVEGVQACSKYMKDLQSARPIDVTNHKYLLPNLLMSDTTSKRVTDSNSIPFQMRTEYQPEKRASRSPDMHTNLQANSHATYHLQPSSISISENQVDPHKTAFGSLGGSRAAAMQKLSHASGPSTSSPIPNVHASFRSRIENLLPERLRDQYQVQQQQQQARQLSREKGYMGGGSYEKNSMMHGPEIDGNGSSIYASRFSNVDIHLKESDKVRSLDYYLTTTQGTNI